MPVCWVNAAGSFEVKQRRYTVDGAVPVECTGIKLVRVTDCMTKLYEISNAYDVSVDWLLGNSDEKKKPTTETGDGLDAKRRRALNLIEAMNDEQLDALLKLLGR